MEATATPRQTLDAFSKLTKSMRTAIVTKSNRPPAAVVSGYRAVVGMGNYFCAAIEESERGAFCSVKLQTMQREVQAILHRYADPQNGYAFVKTQ